MTWTKVALIARLTARLLMIKIPTVVVLNLLLDQRPDADSSAKSAARSKACYDKDPDSSRAKSAARSKACYDKDPDSGAKSTARLKACYDKDPDSGAKSTARSKASYHKDLSKSCENNAARSKVFYEKDIEASRTLKRQRYVVLCVCTVCLLYLCFVQVFFEAT